MQKQIRTYKYRIYPTSEQESVLAQFFGAKRWVYNYYLSEQKRRFELKEKHLSNFDINKLITQQKKEETTSWLKGVDDWCLKNASEDLSNAYSAFFNSIKGKRRGKKMELPRFKKRSNHQSYRTRGIKILDEAVRLPKIKTPVRCVFDRTVPENSVIKSTTVSKTPSGKYFVSIITETPVALKSMTNREVGIDLGVADIL